MQKIIHVTDTHLRPPGETVVGLDPAARLRAVVSSINQNHADAALCVLTGDLADQGEPEAYEVLRDCLAALEVPVRLLLGNHDARAPFCRAFPAQPRDDGGFVQSTAVIGDTACLFLDTLDEERPGEGFLCSARLRWLDAQLRLFAGKPLVVFLHHPPLPIGLAWFDSMLLANGRAVIDRLAGRPGIAHVAFGHVHVNTSGTWCGVSYSASRGTCHKVLSNATAARADYADHGPAYDLLLLGDDGVCVHSVDPAGPTRLIACEFPTEDGKGSFQLFEREGEQRWI